MDIKNKILSIIFVVLGILIVFAVISGISGDLKASSNELNHPNNCSDGVDKAGKSLVINYSDLYCMNSTGNSLYPAKQYNLPLTSVLTNLGVIIAFIAVIIIVIVMMIRNFAKNH